MADNKTVKALIGEILGEIIEEAKEGGGRKTKVGLMAYGSELGAEELCRGARLAMQDDPTVKVFCIGPRLAGFEDLNWIETEPDEHAVSAAMEKALSDGVIEGAVALHYPFPVGVTTIGKIFTPGRGKPCFVASSTGTASPLRTEAMLRNAIYGIAVAKSAGVTDPKVGVLNLDGAQTVLRALQKLKESGYEISFADSIRKGGGAIFRGNDLLAGAGDVCVADTLTGNVLMKLFGAWTTGGDYEAMGWGYGPSAGEGWNRVISIISRASGAPVVAGALSLNARAAKSGLPAIVAKELQAARAAGLDELIEAMQPKQAAAEEDVKAPPSEPTDEEIHGIDVLEIENAVKALWKADVYAESSMGCTGPVIKFAKRNEEKVKEVLKAASYL
ncbi:glycine/sarcosine/betaine reductase complex component C subunit alpha [Synergistes jonesii]|uniref:Glycine reductase n=1 Tax=Synergistes jonesii TaxID=2754 RepID=A0A073IPV0_9BACT|nr:glycine/sarcosine/betaine reductase complex component C subunit alpha [Synergistes jonesii]KEJ91789.1 glycine reductase [Synergistes jonesii]OFB61579.1 glycine reductase [Synergistes jonesii]OFB62155.1 glycine reductase [Synergistes jonesii]OFB65810.1 glycine reductase [Synergistes jonesii]OFB67161.1 glycine reductase [Synergistes jonesii]